ncbi:HmuY family protein [Flavobacterium microcysteis]
MKTHIVIFIGLFLFTLNSCSSDSENIPITTEAVITKNITNLFAGGPITEETPTTYFNLETGMEVPANEANTKKWDISFKRAEIRLNGGVSGPGNAAAIVINNESYDVIEMAPDGNYIKDGSGPNDNSGIGTANGLAFTNWFTYSSDTHTILPEDQVYIIRTANNKYAKLKILSYYSNSTPAVSATYSFKYTLQPGGSKVLK